MVANQFWRKRKTLLYFPEFWYGREPILVKNKRPSCISLNFGMVANQFWVKRKTLLYFPEFWYGREPILVKKKDPLEKETPFEKETSILKRQLIVKMKHSCISLNFGM